MPRIVDQFQSYLRELRDRRPARFGRRPARQGRTSAAHQRGGRALSRARRASQRNDRSIGTRWPTNPQSRSADPLAEAAATPQRQEGATADRILNQEEIDSLLGFDVNDEQIQDKSGVRAIINSALVSYERLPMLEIVFDRLVRLMTTSLRNFTSDNVEVSLDNITSIRFGDYLNSIPLPAILAVFRAEQLDNYGLFTVDSNLIYSIVDVLLGGRRGTAAMRIEGRPYTTIERTLVQRMTEVILQDMCPAFEPLAPVTFSLDRLETNPRFAAIARPANAAILVKLRIDMEDRGGRTELLLPYATLEPIRKLLLQQFMGEKFGRDFDLGKPSGDRIVVHAGRHRRHSRRADDAAQQDHESGGRRDRHAQLEPRIQDRTALRRRAASARTHGPCRAAKSPSRSTKPSNAPTPRARFDKDNAMTFSLIVEIVLTLLLAATLVYCAILERRLAALRKGQDGFRETIVELNRRSRLPARRCGFSSPRHRALPTRSTNASRGRAI